jgi:hypothetical protein
LFFGDLFSYVRDAVSLPLLFDDRREICLPDRRRGRRGRLLIRVGLCTIHLLDLQGVVWFSISTAPSSFPAFSMGLDQGLLPSEGFQIDLGLGNARAGLQVALYTVSTGLEPGRLTGLEKGLPSVFGQNPATPRFHDLGYLGKIGDVEHDRQLAEVAVLVDAAAGEPAQNTRHVRVPIDAGGQVGFAEGVDMAVAARDDHQPEVFDPGARTVLGVVGFLVCSTVLAAELLAKIDAAGGWHGQTPSCSKARMACSAARWRLIGERTVI